MKDEKKFVNPEAEIIELYIIDTLGESGEEVGNFGESQLP